MVTMAATNATLTRPPAAAAKATPTADSAPDVLAANNLAGASPQVWSSVVQTSPLHKQSPFTQSVSPRLALHPNNLQEPTFFLHPVTVGGTQSLSSPAQE